ncbi:MAG: LPD1 domain-containing protein [Bacteroidota bacterium]
MDWPTRIVDTAAVPNRAIERWWLKRGQAIVKEWNKNPIVPKNLRICDPAHVGKYFALRGFEFGNYVNQEERINYVAAVGVSLLHLCKAIRIHPLSIGADGGLTIGIGSRGIPRSSGSYHHRYRVININRWGGGARKVGHCKLKMKTQTKRYLQEFREKGGGGCLAHEVAHWMDNFAGVLLDVDDAESGVMLSGGLKATLNVCLNKYVMLREDFEQLFYKLYYKDNKHLTDFGKAMLKVKRGYWRRREEVFARTFEVFVAMALKRKKVSNTFLCHTLAYYAGDPMYPSTKLVEHVAPIMRRIIRKIAPWMKKFGWSELDINDKYVEFIPRDDDWLNERAKQKAALGRTRIIRPPKPGKRAPTRRPRRKK